MLDKGTILKHYKRKDIQKEILLASKDKEVVGSFDGKGYAKRPDILKYPADIMELVKNGVTSFHASEELWKNPLQLDPMMKKRDMEEVRKGWDLVIDIDTAYWHYAKLTTKLIVDLLKHFEIKNLSVKFSGNKGFHICVPFESLPSKVHDKETRLLFPEAPRRVASYIQERIRRPLANEILKLDNINQISKMSGKKFSELTKKGMFDPFALVDIDTILISSRHLYRMPYSLHEKSGLVSIPINPGKVMEFDKSRAKPVNVEVSEYRFLDRKKSKANEARQLLVQAFDYEVKTYEKITQKIKYTDDVDQKAIPVQFFPPCIIRILKGLEDGRKRSLFLLVNYLTSVGWGYEQIDELLHKWNKKNKEPLREVLIKGQIRYHKQQKKKILPPNCANGMYYRDILVCTPDNLCKKIKNPVNYAKIKTRFLHKKKKGKKKNKR